MGRCKVLLTSPRDLLCQVLLTLGKGRLTLENRLRVLRAERGWSQAELAGHLDVSRQAVNAIETGKYDPSLPLAFKIARLFGQSIHVIFNDGAE